MRTKCTVDMDLNTRNNFHNAGDIVIMVDPTKTVIFNGDELLCLTDYQSTRIEKHFCGMSDCCCGSGPLVEYDYGKYGISTYYYTLAA